MRPADTARGGGRVSRQVTDRSGRAGREQRNARAGRITGLLAALIVLLPTMAGAQPAATLRPADPTVPADLAILQGFGAEVSGRTVRNTCGAVVRPLVALPARGVAVVVETDPTGQCSGNQPPSSIAVLLQVAPGRWRISTSTTGSGFRLGPAGREGKPDIIVQYPPHQRDCPVLGWNGRDYEMTKTCRGAAR